MKCQHDMPFGSKVLESGGVDFRLWAPAHREIKLLLESDPTSTLLMQADAQGWHSLTVPAAQAGSRYRFQLPEGLLVPDPASRFNPDDVHGVSEVINPVDFDWPDTDWCGRPWEDAVIYELHVGAFTSAGTFSGVENRLDYLAELGVTVLEIMPVADFPGRHSWGYDGVLPFAPDASYGRPEDFKRLIAAAHARGLMVVLDVVYNHFGPEGNYLHAYAPDFFNPQHQTPWGAAINFDSPNSRTVRDFFIHNALYWLEEYHLDGLRLDAIHAICDDSSPDFVEELGSTVRKGLGQNRHIHLILENDRNQAHYLRRDKHQQWQHATAQWNDDIHHVLHVLATGETDGYYADYMADPLGQLARCLTEGFAFQGDPSPFRNGELRGEPSNYLPPAAFVNFLQTHDQIGNRALGERLCHLAKPEVLEAMTALLLLSPQPPMLFMGEEFAATQPFLFFCDFGPELAQAVTEGRRREFARFEQFSNPAAQSCIPDPNADSTFQASVLDWESSRQPPHFEMLSLHRKLLAIRHRDVAPYLANPQGTHAQCMRIGHDTLQITWQLKGHTLTLYAQLGSSQSPRLTLPADHCLFSTSNLNQAACNPGHMPPWSVAWYLMESQI